MEVLLVSLHLAAPLCCRRAHFGHFLDGPSAPLPAKVRDVRRAYRFLLPASPHKGKARRKNSGSSRGGCQGRLRRACVDQNAGMKEDIYRRCHGGPRKRDLNGLCLRDQLSFFFREHSSDSILPDSSSRICSSISAMTLVSSSCSSSHTASCSMGTSHFPDRTTFPVPPSFTLFSCEIPAIRTQAVI